MRVFQDVDELAGLDGEVDLGRSEWVTVDQRMIDLFAEATDDHQWIHVDPERAAEGPFGRTIAHGFLTLSLLPRLVSGLYAIESAGMIVNVGSDKVRFLAPVPVDSRIRAHAVITDRERRGDAVRNFFTVTIELEDSDRPAAVVESISQVFPA
jgi:acyl dehydratase